MPVQAVNHTTPSAGGPGSTLKDLTAAFSDAQNAAPSQAAPADKRHLRNPQIPVFPTPTSIPKDQEGKDKALTQAVRHHDAIFARKLIQAGADPDAPLRLTLQAIPRDGNPISKDTLDAVRTIVDNLPPGADINAPLHGAKGAPTALDFAVANLTGKDGALDLIRTLAVDGRADLAKADGNGKAPLDLAKGPRLGSDKQAYDDVEKFLRGKVDGELEAAVKNGDGKRAAELIKAGANGGGGLNGMADKGQDVGLLQYAVASGKTDVVKAILDGTPKADRKALINQQWSGGNTALHAAAAAGQSSLYDELKKDGGDDTIKNIADKTPADLNTDARKRGLFLIPAAAAAISITPLGWAAIAAAGVAALAYAVYNRGDTPAATPTTPNPSPFETGGGGPTYSPTPTPSQPGGTGGPSPNAPSPTPTNSATTEFTRNPSAYGATHFVGVIGAAPDARNFRPERGETVSFTVDPTPPNQPYAAGRPVLGGTAPGAAINVRPVENPGPNTATWLPYELNLTETRDTEVIVPAHPTGNQPHFVLTSPVTGCAFYVTANPNDPSGQTVIFHHVSGPTNGSNNPTVPVGAVGIGSNQYGPGNYPTTERGGAARSGPADSQYGNVVAPYAYYDSRLRQWVIAGQPYGLDPHSAPNTLEPFSQSTGRAGLGGFTIPVPSYAPSPNTPPNPPAPPPPPAPPSTSAPPRPTASGPSEK